MKRKKTLWIWILTGIGIFLTVLAAAFLVYVSFYYKAGPIALNSLQSDSLVKVEQQGDILFRPVSNGKSAGLIIYPGAKVEASAYAPLAKEVASRGYTVIIAKMNFNLAILSQNKADRIIKNNTQVRSWVIGGHSLGGVMAAEYALKHDNIKGLVLLASYPMENRDFRSRKLKVLSLWGGNDKVADLNKVKEAKKVMPSDSEFEEIQGGNHGGFGDYGHQKGDGKASITNKQQMIYASDFIIKLLDSLD